MSQQLPLEIDNARDQAGKSENQNNQHADSSSAASTGQLGKVLNLIHRHQPLLSLRLTADYAIPEAAARVHDLRAAGLNVLTTIHPAVIFRGVERRNVAGYSLGTPEWPRPGFFDGGA